MAAWAAWVQLVALAEFARRRPQLMSGSRGAREVAEEAAWKIAETWTRMLDQLTFAVTVTTRLPRTLEAMQHGQVSEHKMRIIGTQTAELSDADVAKADVILAAAGQVKNPAGLRDYARRQVMRLDPVPPPPTAASPAAAPWTPSPGPPPPPAWPPGSAHRSPRSPPARASTRMRNPATHPAASSATSSRPETPAAPHLAAAAPPPPATWTTPDRGRTTARPVRATLRPCVAPIIG